MTEPHTSELLIEKSNCNSVDLFHDPWALETHLSHIVESHKHIGAGKFSFLYSEGKKNALFAEVCGFPPQTEISPFPTDERFMSLRMKFLSVRDPEGRFLKVV